jgi:hypothetical protein
MSHQATDEMDVSAQSIELRNDHGALQFLRCCQGCLELWAPFDRIAPLAALDLNEFPREFQTLSLGELSQGRPLCRKT